MQITQVTVGAGATQSLPDYCNIKPSLTLTATVETGDDPNVVIANLAEQAIAYVHEQIDDALESTGKSPRYTTAPLYRLARWEQFKMLVILPGDVQCSSLPGNWEIVQSAPQRKHTIHVLGDKSCEPGESFVELTPDEIAGLWAGRTWYAAFRGSGTDFSVILIREELIDEAKQIHPRLRGMMLRSLHEQEMWGYDDWLNRLTREHDYRTKDIGIIDDYDSMQTILNPSEPDAVANQEPEDGPPAPDDEYLQYDDEDEFEDDDEGDDEDESYF